jgi:hypothetical protein
MPPVKKHSAWIVFLLWMPLGLACATLISPASGNPTASATPAAGTLTASAPAPIPTTEAPAMATRVPAATLWMCFGCTGDQAWVLDSSSPHQITLPISLGSYYGFSRELNQILFAPTFADHGAGPANISVSGLALLDLGSGVVHHLAEDNVAEAYWAPDGLHLAYILATATTYELHWRSPNGNDRRLASDVTFTWSISPDSRSVAFTRESRYQLDIIPGLYVVKTEGGKAIQISDVDKSGTGSLSDQPIWSPDSSQVLLPAWAGPPPARLVLAQADGGGSVDLQVDPALRSNWWAVDAIPEALWYPDGDHLLTLPAASQMEMGGPNPLVKYRIDRAAQMLTDGELLGEAMTLIGWDHPGETLWALSYAGEITRLTFP